MDCGHGIGRQHKAVKYSERNNNAQCGPCNLDGGRQDVYKQEVDKKYGPGSWDLLLLQSRQTYRRTAFELKVLINYYKEEVKKLKAQKL